VRTSDERGWHPFGKRYKTEIVSDYLQEDCDAVYAPVTWIKSHICELEIEELTMEQDLTPLCLRDYERMV